MMCGVTILSPKTGAAPAIGFSGIVASRVHCLFTVYLPDPHIFLKHCAGLVGRLESSVTRLEATVAIAALTCCPKHGFDVGPAMPAFFALL